MVNDAVSLIPDPTRALVVRYAPPAARGAVAALLALDDTFAAVLRTTREPIVAQMRFAWWDEQLRASAAVARGDQPVLAALQAAAERGVDVGGLAAMIDGWEVLLGESDPDEEALVRYARARGGTLFAALGHACGSDPGDPVASGGEGWALADLIGNLSDPALAARAGALAAPRLAAARRWSRNGRALGALVHLARGRDEAPPRRLARLLYHRVTGR